MMMPTVASKRVYRFAVGSFSGGLDQGCDQQCLNIERSPEAHNVRVEDGTLKRGFGYSRLKKYNPSGFAIMQLPAIANARGMFLKKQKMGASLLVACDDGLYQEDLGLGETVFTRKSDAKVDFYLSYRNGENEWTIKGGEQYGLEISTQDTAMVHKDLCFVKAFIFAERLFGAQTVNGVGRIRFSKQYAPDELEVGIDAGGYIDVVGKYGEAVDMVVMNNSIYNVWKNGVTRLKAYGYQSEFELEECFEIQGIKSRSVQVCGNRIVFVTDDGAYTFDGTGVKKISDTVASFFNAGIKDVVSAAYGNKYYLAFHSDGYQGSENNVVLVYDVLSQRWSVLSEVTVKCMATLDIDGDTKLVFVGEDDYIFVFDKSETYGGKPINSKWTVPMGTLGRAELIKEIRSVIISAQGAGRIRITVKSERGSASKHIEIDSQRRVYSVPMRVRGKLIGLELENVDGNDFTVAEPTVLYTVTRTR